MYLGIIADDFTGGTDIAGFLVQNGLSVTQYLGVPQSSLMEQPSDAVVISLKSRSCPVEEAVNDSLSALKWLQKQGCKKLFFKYCSTFDSTDKGNIGPVTDALLDALQSNITVMVPALPVNGRTVYMGYLFVNVVPLNESGMRNHPVTPMLDANIMRLTEQQSLGKAANIPFSIMEEGPQVVRQKIKELQEEGIRYIVPDVLKDDHLMTLGESVADFPLVTGGSGLGMAMAYHLRKRYGLDSKNSIEAGKPPGGKCVILAGSASVMTNVQVKNYADQGKTRKIDVHHCIEDADSYAESIAKWVISLPSEENAPLVYATASPEELNIIQKTFGAEISAQAVEHFFSSLARRLKIAGFDHFIIAGGETSGAVVKALGIKAFYIGPQIAPGVPWVRAVDMPISLALKSGNFGGEDFFSIAQTFYKQ